MNIHGYSQEATEQLDYIVKENIKRIHGKGNGQGSQE